MANKMGVADLYRYLFVDGLPAAFSAFFNRERGSGKFSAIGAS
jgi:hypothetical protein